MNTDPKTSSDAPADPHMGITFNEIHSDEDHEEIAAGKTAVEKKYPTLGSSHLSNKEDVFNVTKAFAEDHVEQGTIVSDRRRPHSSLRKNLSDAFSEWWGGTKRTVTNAMSDVQERIHTEEPTIEKATARAEIVKEAGSRATFAPVDDHHVVIEKVRTYKQDVARATGTPMVIKAAEPQKPTWAHETPKIQRPVPEHIVATPDLRSSMVAPIIQSKIKKDIKEFVPQRQIEKKPYPVSQPMVQNPAAERVVFMQIPATVEKKVTAPLNRPVYAAEQVTPPTKNIRPETPPPPVRTPFENIIVPSIPDPVKPKVIIGQNLPRTPEETVVPEIPRQPVPAKAASSKETTFHTTITPSAPAERRQESPRMLEPRVYAAPVENNSLRHIIRYVILGCIAILGITLAIAANIYFNVFGEQEEQTQPTVTTPTVVPTEATLSLLLHGTGDAFLSALTTEVEKSPSGFTRLYPMIQDGEILRTATGEEMLTFLQVNLDGKAIRALSNTISIGSITTTKNEPFIILESFNFDELFSGFLKWETHIHSDFAPLFGDAVPPKKIFTDAVRNNASTRILYDASGKEMLLYSFINQHTVVITTSGEALSKILEEI